MINFISHFLNKKPHSQMFAITVVALFVMATANGTLLKNLTLIYPVSLSNLPFLISLVLFFSLLTLLFFLVISFGRAGRWLVAGILIISAMSAYYLDYFGVLMDVVMVDNIVHTDPAEAAGLMNVGLLVRTFVMGIVPAWLVIKYWPKVVDVKKAMVNRFKWIALTCLALIIVVLPFGSGYASFIRQHKTARFYAIPTYPIYSLIKYGTNQLVTTNKGPLKTLATDAEFIGPESRGELIVLVVGETARADHFSLNGYERETNPLLSKLDVMSLKNVSSCGTSTGVSVPCMFSSLTRAQYDKGQAQAQENVLDVLANNGVHVLWRDNNSDSKGVANRVNYQDFKQAPTNPVCDVECRDVGMLSGLGDYLADKKGQDVMIVLHQMGNHGPEYFKRYPQAFEAFKPACKTGELQACSKQEIDNSYDNAILYTDYFLSEVIGFLKKQSDDFATAMVYVSDHGESLGEHGIYLHAAPYMMAPEAQTHVPAIVWMDQHFDYQLDQLKPFENTSLSHDDLFCSVLIGFELETSMCFDKRDMLMGNKDIKAAGVGVKPDTQ